MEPRKVGSTSQLCWMSESQGADQTGLLGSWPQSRGWLCESPRMRVCMLTCVRGPLRPTVCARIMKVNTGWGYGPSNSTSFFPSQMKE